MNIVEEEIATASTIGGGVSRITNMVPSAGSLFSAYATASTSLRILQEAYSQLVPNVIRHCLNEFFYRMLDRCSKTYTTFLVEEHHEMKRNPLYDSFEVYLRNLMTMSASFLKATPEDDNPGGPLSLQLTRSEKFKDEFESFEIVWDFQVITPLQKGRQTGSRYYWSDDDDYMMLSLSSSGGDIRRFKLWFQRCYKEVAVKRYVPMVVETANKIRNEEKVLKLWTRRYFDGGHNYAKWDSVKLNHPANFKTLALDPSLKKSVIEDLDLFMERKDYYKKVGRAWKRGYLLYGPPGTGKSSLIAAMANYLKFNVYDLQLKKTDGDDVLRKLLISTSNQSIILIEDIDCSMGLPSKRNGNDTNDEDGEYDDTDFDEEEDKLKQQQKSNYNNGVRDPAAMMSLSGLLNFIDGLWSSCGDQRIIIFTTNHKDRIDSALLRPGRMDMHIHMSYLCVPAFTILTTNYLRINTTSEGEGDCDHSSLLGEIEVMIQNTNVTPAEVAEELMRSKDAEVALQGVLELLKRKKVEMEAEKKKRQGARASKRMRKEKREAKKAVVEALLDSEVYETPIQFSN